MRPLRALLIRIASLFGPSRRDREFADEIESHLQLHIDDNVRAGMTPEQARCEALLRLGGATQTRERYRDRLGLPWVDAIRQDAAYACRMLRRNPGFTATAVVTLALGIGANTAIFSVVNAVLLRPLPFRDPDRLVMIFATDSSRNNMYDVASYPDFVDWRAQARTFDGMTAFTNRAMTLTTASETVLVQGKRITASVFDVLGVRPAIGRPFRADEERAGHSQVVVLSDGFWRRYYGGSPGALGRTLRINDEPHTIIGVMATSFHIDSSEREQFYVPLTIDPSRGHAFLRVIARLRSGVGISPAQADMNVITARLATLYPKNDAVVGANVMPLTGALARDARAGLFIMLAVVAVVLLIACINVAGLMLARGASRQREMAVRAALGAGRRRLVRQLLTESLLIAAGGGGLGLLAAAWTSRLLAAALAATFQVPRVEATRTDAWVLGFTMLLSLVTGVLFGVAPALSSASPDLNDALRDANRSATAARAPRLRSTFVVIETALALVLLASAGVLLKTFVTLRSTPPGFEPSHVLALDLWLPQPRFATLPARAQFFQQAQWRVRQLPGVRSAALVADLPLNGGTDALAFHIVGRPDPRPRGSFTAGFNIATPDYFKTLRIPIRAGREFVDADRRDTMPVVVINETAARRFWLGESPLGKQIDLPGSNRTSMRLTVIGVTGDVRHAGLGVPPRPEFFVSSLQSPLTWPSLVLVVRTDRDPAAIADSVKAAIREVNANVPIERVNALETVVSRSIAEPKIYTLLVGTFASLAVALAAVGLYGLVSYTVSQRTHELGIRVALGAARSEIVRLVLGQGLRLAALGTLIGLIGAWATTRVLIGLIRNVQPTDPTAFASVALLLLAVAVAATYLPARRAARVDPVVALRSE